MAYIECRNAVIATIQTLTAYFPAASQVVACDETVLDRGVTNAAVLLPGPVGLISTRANYIRTWGIILDLYRAWSGDLLSSLAPFEILRDAVLLAIDENPNLVVAPATSGISGVLEVEVVSDGDAGPYTHNKGVVFVAQRFRITVQQHLRAS